MPHATGLAEQVSPVQFRAKLVQLELDLLLILPSLRLESEGAVDPVDLRLRPACERESVGQRPSSRCERGGAPATCPYGFAAPRLPSPDPI